MHIAEIKGCRALLSSHEIDGENENQLAKSRPGRKLPLGTGTGRTPGAKGMSDMLTAPWDARPAGKLGSRLWWGLTSGQAVEDDLSGYSGATVRDFHPLPQP